MIGTHRPACAMQVEDSLSIQLTNGMQGTSIRPTLVEDMLGMGEGREEYYREWYDEHRPELLVKRRSRYATDPEYAERCRESARKYRRERKGRTDVAEKRPRKPFTVTVGGHTDKGYTVGYVAEKVGRSVATVNHWLKSGLLPVTPLVSDGGARLYTERMIAVIAREVSSRDRVMKSDKTFYSSILQEWESMGVF